MATGYEDNVFPELTEIGSAVIPQPTHRIMFAGLGRKGLGALTVEWEDEPGALITSVVATAAASLLHDCAQDGSVRFSDGG